MTNRDNNIEQKKLEESFKSKDKKVKNNIENKEKTEDSIETNSLEIENGELKEKLLRTLAELENTRRIAIEEREKTIKFALTNFVKDLILVMEDFYLAMDDVKNKEKNESFQSFYEGIELTFNELKKIFEKNKINRLYPINEKFNPDFHEAIAHLEKEGIDGGVIIEVMQAGYTLNDRIIRPALVTVSK